jgi:tol-pal system protein YbgF
MRALRAENARLEERLERLEQARLVAAAPRPAAMPAPQALPPPSVATTTPSGIEAIPPLAVVKLKPRKEAAPRLPTDVEVEEPAELPPLVASSPESPLDEADLSIAETQFERALALMKTGASERGVAQMQQFVTDWPRHPRADNALYFAGLAHMAEKNFESAAALFERVLAQYPAGDAVLDSMLKLAECRHKLNRTREAKATWEKIVSTFPGTAAASQAQARLASLSSSP